MEFGCLGVLDSAQVNPNTWSEPFLLQCEGEFLIIVSLILALCTHVRHVKYK